MLYRGKHAKPLVNWRRLGEYLAMAGFQLALMLLIFVIWVNG